MMSILRLTAVLVPMFALTGCGWLFGEEGVFRDPSEDYKKAPELTVIDVPADKEADNLQEIYPIPPVRDNLVLEGEFEVPRPAPLVAGASDEVVRIQKLGDESWALVAEAPGQVWPQVRSFMAGSGITVARVDARAGVMESSWLQLEGQPMASRYQFRIEQGVQRGTSELHVLQMNQAGDINSWPQVSDDLAQESQMLQAVAQYIANSSEAAPVSMVAEQAISATGRISLQESPEGYTYIDLQLPFSRAWASLDRALGASTFQVTDRDRSAGLYYATFLGPQAEDDGGWFDWLWGDDEEHPLAGDTFIVSIESRGDDAVVIRLRPQDPGYNLEKRDEQALLSLIKGNMS